LHYSECKRRGSHSPGQQRVAPAIFSW